MKKLISLFLVFMLLVTVVPFNALADTDEIEINVYSKIFKAFYNKSTNTLSITGKGFFDSGVSFGDYNNGNPFYWDEIALDNTKTIVISEGITGIDDFAFIGFQNVETLILPN